MAEKSVYDLIKKQNGERFAKAIRNHDNGIFDIPDIVNIVKYAGHDAEPIIPYLTSLKSIKIQDVENPEDPFELLYSVGYRAEYANTLQKQNSIRRYFYRGFQRDGEGLCTFWDYNRYKNYYIVNVVHRDADKLKRADFTHPQREDKYGTSVMSIQILKTGGFISIKNRYNHTVENPDNTYNSNPDNIVPGLSAALKKYFNVDFTSHQVSLPRNYVFINNQIIKYNYEHNNVYYGSDFWMHNGIVHEIDKRHQIMMDYGVFDLKTKSLDRTQPYDRKDSFFDVLGRAMDGNKINISKTPAGATRISINDEHGTWVDVRDGCVVGVNMPGETKLPYGFMCDMRAVRELYFPNVTDVANSVLGTCVSLENIDMPAVKTMGDHCLWNLGHVGNIVMNELETVGDACFISAPNVTRAEFQKLRKTGREFFSNAGKLRFFSAPNAKSMGDHCLCGTLALEFVNLSSLERVGNFFMQNAALPEFSADNLKTIGAYGFYSSSIKKLWLPALVNADSYFANDCRELVSVYTPILKELKACAFRYTSKLQVIDLSSLERAGNSFMSLTGLKEFRSTSLRELGTDAFAESGVTTLWLDNLVRAGNGFGGKCVDLVSAYLPQLRDMDGMTNLTTFAVCENLERVFAPNLTDMPGGLRCCPKLRDVTLDSLRRASKSFSGAREFMEGSRIPELYLPNVEEFEGGAFDDARIGKLIAPAVTVISPSAMKDAHIGYVRFDSLAPEQVPESIRRTYKLSRGRDRLKSMMHRGLKAIGFEKNDRI